MPIYCLCPDYITHAGGVRVIYRHVDLLRRHGYEAFVVHERRGFRDKWFESETPVLSWSRRRHRIYNFAVSRAVRHIGMSYGRGLRTTTPLQLREPCSFEITPGDIVVIPEIYGPWLAEIAPGVPKVIFVQNAYEIFFGYPSDQLACVFPYRHADVVGILAISDDSQRIIDYTFPGVKSYRVRLSLNPSYYYFCSEKRSQIAYMPRKGSEDAKRVLMTLASRGVIGDYRVRAIENLDERGVAECLRESLVFLCLSYHEGFGLPPAEAMACGAIVIGYDGFGGREYILPEFAFPVPAGNVLEFSQTVERVLALQRERPDELRERARQAAAFVAETYSPAREEEELLAVWSEILAARGPRPSLNNRYFKLGRLNAARTPRADSRTLSTK